MLATPFNALNSKMIQLYPEEKDLNIEYLLRLYDFIKLEHFE